MLGIERSAEYVGTGHIDRVCDLIAQRILTEALAQDENSRVAIEVSCSKDILLIFGEVTTKAKLNYSDLAKEVLEECLLGKDYYNPVIIENVNTQSSNIANRVNKEELCWGDQSTTVGHYAPTPSNGLYEPYYIARNIVTMLESDIVSGEMYTLNFTKDIKCLVEVSNDKIKGIMISIQTFVEEVNKDRCIEEIEKKIYELYGWLMSEGYISIVVDLYPRTKSLCDAGTTNRKITVDMYGTASLADGGGYNGKDYTKGDMAGKILAEDIAQTVAKKIEEQFPGEVKNVDTILNFHIGLPKPHSIIAYINNEPLLYSIEEWEEMLGFEFTLQSVVEHYNLKNIDYYNLGVRNLSYHTIVTGNR